MLQLDEYAHIRHAYFSRKKSMRAIARETGCCWRTVRKIIEQAEPQPYQRDKKTDPPRLTQELQEVVRQILREDEKAPRKQRHTAAQIFRRLQSEHQYQGGYDQVRRQVAAWKQNQRETFLPLDHPPGQRMEADFGQIHVDFPQGRRAVSVLVLTWAWSDCPYAVAMPTQRTEAILQGMADGFAFFGCAPHEVWWDNPKTVAQTILVGRQRELHPRYLALASHYAFAPLFCLPRRGQEKPRVEGRVKQLQRRWATPVPRVENLAALNQLLLSLCLADRERTVTGQSQSIGERFVQERSRALDLPTRAFDPCVMQTVSVDKYQTAAFDTNRYSVPRSHAFRMVTVKGYVDRVEIVDQGQALARHERCYERGQQILEPLHYLTTLDRKPACLDHAPVYRDWRLPPCFPAFREALQTRYGTLKGARQYIRVLQLLAEHPLERVQQALESVPSERAPSADRIIRLTQSLRQQSFPYEGGVMVTCSDGGDAAAGLHSPPPDLKQYDFFLSSDEVVTSTCEDDDPSQDGWDGDDSLPYSGEPL